MQNETCRQSEAVRVTQDSPHGEGRKRGLTRQLQPVVVLLVLFMTLPILQGCSDNGQTNALGATYLNVPRVSSITFTDSLGKEIGFWGNPPQETLGSLFNYPNPFNPTTTIKFSIPNATYCRLWITRALGPGESEDDLLDAYGGIWLNPQGAPLLVLVDRNIEAGSHSVCFDVHDFPDGFYCYHLEVGDFYERKFMLFWTGHSGIVPDFLTENGPGEN